jgi:hypothetical protein
MVSPELDVGARVARLEAFEQWREPTKVDYESIIGRERWAKYLKMMDDIASLMKLAQASSG